MSDVYLAVTGDGYIAGDGSGDIYIAVKTAGEPPEDPPVDVLTYKGEPLYHDGQWLVHT